MFLPNIIKINPYNFELYCFKFGSFLRQCSSVTRTVALYCYKVVYTFKQSSKILYGQRVML